MFTLPVKNVSKTRILVAPVGNNLQLTVYDNTVKSASANNAMILPIPFHTKTNIELLDLSLYGQQLWDDCDKVFTRVTKSFGTVGSFSFGSAEHVYLPISQVGGYQCSLAQSIDQMKLVDPSVFTLPENIEIVLREHYATGYAFAVCIFSGDVAAHPIGYISERDTNGRLFIPTRHEHGDITTTHDEQQPFNNFKQSGGFEVNLPTHDIGCVSCSVYPIRGDVYCCAMCSYNVCSACHSRGGHPPTHLFMHVPHPLQQQYTFAPRQPVALKPRPRSLVADYDHEIYIVNAVALCSGYQISNQQSAVISDMTNYVAWSRISHKLEMYKARHVQKLSIHGSFTNNDYWGMPLMGY